MDEYNGIEISKRLNECIRNSGKTRAEFAKECGIAKSTIDGHCSNNDKDFTMSTKSLYMYSKALNVSMDYLISGDDNLLSRQMDKVNQENVLYAFAILIQVFGEKSLEFERDMIGRLNRIKFSWEDTELLDRIKVLTDLINLKYLLTPEEYSRKLEEVCKKEQLKLFDGLLPKNSIIPVYSSDSFYEDFE